MRKLFKELGKTVFTLYILQSTLITRLKIKKLLENQCNIRLYKYTVECSITPLTHLVCLIKQRNNA